MRRRIKRSSLFTLIAVVALLSLGIGYAAWTSELKVNATVDTGTFAVEWSDESVKITEFKNPLSVTATKCELDADYPDDMTFTVSNAYPGVECRATGTITNNGTVPAKFVDIDPDTNGSVAGEVIFTANCSIAPGETLAVGATATCTASVVVLGGAEQTDDYESKLQLNFALPD